MKNYLISLVLAIVIKQVPIISGSTIFEKEFPGKGVLSCVLVEQPIGSGEEPGRLHGSKTRSELRQDYQMLWTPVGMSKPEILWQIAPAIERTQMAKVLGAGVFMPFDGHVWMDGNVFLVFRTSTDILSAVLRVGQKFNPSESNIKLVVPESTRKSEPLRVFGGGQLGGNLKPTDLNLVLDGNRGREVFGYDGKVWQHLRLEPYSPFEKEIPGIGKIGVQQTEISFPKGFEAPTYERRDSAEAKALMNEIREDRKDNAHIQSLHRHELYLIKNGQSERISLLKKTTYFDPKQSRCPKGFRLFDALFVGDRVYFVYLEQNLLRWARVDITGAGITARESRDVIGRENAHGVFSKATLRVGPGTEGICVDVESTGGNGSVPLTRNWFWEEEK